MTTERSTATQQGRGSRSRGASPTKVLVVAAVAVAAVWLVIVVAWRDAPFALTFDDAFYYFGIARNVAHGHGSTFDGIDPTNGYHPLWMLIAVPFFSAGLDGTGAARALLALQVLFYGGALVLVALTVGRAIGHWDRLRVGGREGDGDGDGGDGGGDGSGSGRSERGADAARWCTRLVAGALVLVGGNPFFVKIFANGLESGVLVLLDAALLWLAARRRRAWLTKGTSSDRLWAALLLSLIVLARTDSVLLVGALGLWTLAEARTLGARAIRPLLELFVLPAATLAAYLLSNQVMFGVPLQISGIVKRASLTPGRALTMGLVVVVALAIGRLGWVRGGRRAGGRGRFRRSGAFAASTAWFAGFCIVLVAYYQVLQTQQWLWYYAPVALYALFLLVLGVADFVEAAALEAPGDRTTARALAPVVAILFAPLLFAFVFQARSFLDPDLRSIEEANRDAGEWIDANLPSDAVLASWDAGVVGYYARRPVINLDGVANSKEYYDAGRNGTVGTFLSDRGLTGIVNHGTPVDGRDPEIDGFIKGLWGADTAATAEVTKSWPFRFSGNTVGGAGRGSGSSGLAVFLYAVEPPTRSSG